MTDEPPRIVVVGSINADLVMRLERLPRAGETLLGRSLARSAGGKGANQAVAAARAGAARTAFVGAVGADPDGEFLRESLGRAAVTPLLAVSADEPSGTAIVLVDDTGNNAISVLPGANASVDPDAHARFVAEADVLLLQLEIPLAAVERAIRLRGPDTLVVLNAAPASPLPPALLREIDVLVVNEEEALGLTGAADVDTASSALGELVPTTITTLGADGCLVVHGGRAERSPAFPAHAVDTTAAGDTFCGVLAAELGRGSSSRRAVELAMAASSLAVERRGAQDSVPTRPEMLARAGTRQR